MIRKNINLLVPELQVKCRGFLARCATSKVLQDKGYQVILLETGRDLAVQMAYAVRGRLQARPEDGKTSYEWIKEFFLAAGLWNLSMNEALVPSTWTLKSKHLEGKAFDAGPSKDGIRVDWQAPLEVWEEMHKIARELGLKCGADFPGGKIDRPHYEV